MMMASVQNVQSRRHYRAWCLVVGKWRDLYFLVLGVGLLLLVSEMVVLSLLVLLNSLLLNSKLLFSLLVIIWQFRNKRLLDNIGHLIIYRLLLNNLFPLKLSNYPQPFLLPFLLLNPPQLSLSLHQLLINIKLQLGLKQFIWLLDSGCDLTLR